MTNFGLLIACIILLASLDFVTAGCLSCVKNIFKDKRSSDWEKLANQLDKRLIGETGESDYVKAAWDLGGEKNFMKNNEEFRELVHSLSMINLENKDFFCNTLGLENVRRLASGMANEGGNLDPQKATEPIRQLNHFIIGLVQRAWSICPAHLELDYPAGWQPESTQTISARHLNIELYKLALLPEAFIFEGLRPATGKAHRDFPKFLKFFKMQAQTLDQSQEFKAFYESLCNQFTHNYVARTVFKPYADLLAAIYFIDKQSGKMDKFYQSADLEVPEIVPADPENELAQQANKFAVCERFYTISSEHLNRLMSEV